jgi:uncharacterized protein YgbK (DUF1537 family)
MIYVIADDLTGACDTGAGFAKRGFRTAVRIAEFAGSEPPAGTVDVLVLNTESRYQTQVQAVRAVRAAAQLVHSHSSGEASLVYKKIDSTLRGHPGAELHALMDALHLGYALVTPAFPAQGRTVVGGELLVQGQPLAQTVFAHEGAQGRLRDVCAHSEHPHITMTLDEVRHIAGNVRGVTCRTGITLADAQTDADLQTLAHWALTNGIRLLCGSAGLATALAGQLPQPNVTRETLPQPTGATFVVAGSLHPTTARQVQYMREKSLPVEQPPMEWLEKPDTSIPNTFIDALLAHLGQDGCAVLSTAGLPEFPLGREVVAQRLGAAVAEIARAGVLGRLVLTGGDVATAACAALDAHWLTLCGEAQPGIAIGQLADGPHAGLQVVTKAGGFGGDDALARQIHVRFSS